METENKIARVARKSKMKKNRLETDEENFPWVDDIYQYQKKYFKTKKGKKALKKARKKYDKKDIERRRRQKRRYMRRKREENPDIWR
jgi:hypothetical protein